MSSWCTSTRGADPTRARRAGGSRRVRRQRAGGHRHHGALQGGLEAAEEHAHIGTIDVIAGVAAVATAITLYVRKTRGVAHVARRRRGGGHLQLPFMLDGGTAGGRRVRGEHAMHAATRRATGGSPPASTRAVPARSGVRSSAARALRAADVRGTARSRARRRERDAAAAAARRVRAHAVGARLTRPTSSWCSATTGRLAVAPCACPA